MCFQPGWVLKFGTVSLLFLSITVPTAPRSVAASEAISIAVFDFELLDTSLQGEIEGVDEKQQKRLKLISNLLHKMLDESERFRVVDTGPVAGEIEAGGNWQGCNGCDARIAAKLGAKYSVTGVVQKVSNLILNINIYFRDTETRKIALVASADIRGNTDKSWSRGVSWLVRNRLLK